MERISKFDPMHLERIPSAVCALGFLNTCPLPSRRAGRQCAGLVLTAMTWMRPTFANL